MRQHKCANLRESIQQRTFPLGPYKIEIKSFDAKGMHSTEHRSNCWDGVRISDPIPFVFESDYGFKVKSECLGVAGEAQIRVLRGDQRLEVARGEPNGAKQQTPSAGQPGPVDEGANSQRWYVIVKWSKYLVNEFHGELCRG